MIESLLQTNLCCDWWATATSVLAHLCACRGRQTIISFRCEMTWNWIRASHPRAIKDGLTVWSGQNGCNRQHYGAIRKATNLVSFAFQSRMNYRSKETMRLLSMRRRLECVHRTVQAYICLRPTFLNYALSQSCHNFTKSEHIIWAWCHIIYSHRH